MNTILLFATLSLVSFASPTFAADSTPSGAKAMDAMNPNKADREKMAAAHAQMATCLRSDQDYIQCHDALHKECQSMMTGSCPGMQMRKGMQKGMNYKD